MYYRQLLTCSLTAFDGWAEDVIQPGEFKDYYYPNTQAARTLWYHVSPPHVRPYIHVIIAYMYLYIPCLVSHVVLGSRCGNYFLEHLFRSSWLLYSRR